MKAPDPSSLTSEKLVEHFFRHEYGRLVGLLTQTCGVRHLELVEDAVQMALWRALQIWSRRGVPTAPAAWLYRTARNLAIDALRRQANSQRAFQFLAQSEATQDDRDHVAHGDDESISDPTLRLLFLCCQPSIPVPSQIALALKIVGGFSIEEIASGLLGSPGNVEKRITRAKVRLREEGHEIATLTVEAMQERIESVLLVLYLMFNEGFAASQGETVLKHDVCEEAIRLTRMLVDHPLIGQSPSAAALLALMLMHSARFNTRLDADECIVLLADQDRTAWDWARVREAMQWMLLAARGDHLSRYHIEVAIAWEHCRASELAQTDWQRVSELYRLLMQVAPSPMVRLNALIARSYHASLSTTIEQLTGMAAEDRQQLRPWWDCALAQMLERLGDKPRAASHWRDALALAGCTASRKLIEKRLHYCLSCDSLPHL